ncbi:hypothetical protein BX600DRAFT_430267 [Xylariales sp. PMI_506]|nr:hypothetical protein BX600DRAFT_430267 [Xylariales sp. PMI_506]
MCLINKLECYICKQQNAEYSNRSKREANNLYAFHPCEQFLQDTTNLQGRRLHTNQRLYCPNIQWPPPTDIITKWVCEDCIGKGGRIYRFNVESDHARRALQHEFRGCAISEVSDNDDDSQENARYLPDSFRLLTPMMQSSVLRMFFDNRYVVGDQVEGAADQIRKDIDVYWIKRSSQAADRMLTIWIPRCVVCKKPTVTGEEDDPYIDDIEIEPNSVLWRWFPLVQKERLIETYIQTGFILKPCQLCVREEEHMRKKVRLFLEEHTDKNAIGWFVYSWLLSRGIGNIPMWDHAALNAGHPDKKAPSTERMMALMAESWRRATGFPWEDVYDLPSFGMVSRTLHDTPLTSYSKWPEARRDTPLEVRHIPRHIEHIPDDDTMDNDVESTSGHQPGYTHNSAQTQAGDISDAQQFLQQLVFDKKTYDRFVSISGKSKRSMNSNIKAVVTALKVYSKHQASQVTGTLDNTSNEILPEARNNSDKARGSAKFSSLRSDNQERHDRLKDAGKAPPAAQEPHPPQSMRKDTALATINESSIETETGRARTLNPNSQHTEKNAMVTFKGAYVDMTTGTAVRAIQDTQYTRSASKRADAVSQNTNEAHAVHAMEKHVRFAEGLDLMQEATLPPKARNDEYILPRLSESEEERHDGDGDAEMDSLEYEMPALAEDEGSVVQCDFHFWHLVGAGKAADASGELVFLPLGIHID